MPELPDLPKRLLTPPAGSFDRIYRAGLQRRRRHLTGVAGIVIAVGVAVGTLVAVQGAGGTKGDSRLTPVTPASATATPSASAKPLSYAERIPRYLPPGVTLRGKGVGNDPDGQMLGTVYWAHYDVAGYANSPDNLGRGISLAIYDDHADRCGPPLPTRPTEPRPKPGALTSTDCESVTWIDIYLIDDRHAQVDRYDYGLGEPTGQTTIRGTEATTYLPAGTSGTMTAGLLWRTSECTIVLTGNSGITTGQLDAVAQGLRVWRHF